MAKNDKKSYKLSIYLLKAEIEEYRTALKEDINIQEDLPFKAEIEAKGGVIIGATKQNISSWRDLIQDGVNNILPDLENSSNRAIVFFEIDKRIFALVFGYGKHLLKDEAIDREFGLKTVLNIVNPERLLSIDKANLDELTVLTRTQTSRRSNPETFNIDVIKDLLRGITGEPNPEFDVKFGKVITGSEGICIIPKVNFKDIPDSLKELKKAYESTKYKTRFGWIDNLKNEHNPDVLNRLKENLIKSLKGKENSAVHLAPPNLIDWESFEGFSYTPKGELFTDFDIENFYTQKEDALPDLTWDKLLDIHLHFKYGDDEDRYSAALWRCLNYQTEYNNNLYVFALSKWYRVNKKYADEIIQYVKEIEESDLIFIDCTKGQKEGDYNISLANSDKSYYLFDMDFVSTDFTRSKIEVCDILSSKMEFVHIKFRHSSATLSHLFAQGKISAYSLRKDKTFRKNLRSKFTERGLDKNLISLESRDFIPSNYTITFAIIEEKDRSFIDSLPFFSLLNFRLTAEELILLGYKVKVKKIRIT